MRLKEDIKLLNNRKFYTVGALHILRSEEDLMFSMVNCMQSLRVILSLIKKCKSKYKQHKTQFVRPLEQALSKLMKQLSVTIIELKENRERFCVPGVSVVIEAVAVMLTRIVISFLKLDKKYDSVHRIAIIGMVLYLSNVDFEDYHDSKVYNPRCDKE